MTKSKPARERPHFEHLIDRPARLQPCRYCGHQILAAIASGVPVRCDPGSLDTRGEITAVLEGKSTYDAIARLGKTARVIYLVWRDQARILHRKYPVLAAHRCDGTGRYPITGAIDLVVPSLTQQPAEPPY